MAEEIRSSGELKKQKEDRRRLSRAAAKREREQMLERQAALEEEIKRLYPISITLWKKTILIQLSQNTSHQIII